MKFSLIALLLLLLAGCVSPQPTYIAPAGLTAQNAASITGSLVKTGKLSNNEQVFIAAIDNVPTKQYGPNLRVPLLVAPGLHVLQIGACECGGWLEHQGGNTSIAVNLQAGQSYVAKTGIPSSQYLLFTPYKTTQAWLEDSTGKIVSTPQPLTLTPPPAPVFIPIIIPAH